MKLETDGFRLGSRFAADPLPLLGFEQSMALVYGASWTLAGPGINASVAEAFPSSLPIGCSTSGEISSCDTEHCDLHTQTMTLTTSVER